MMQPTLPERMNSSKDLNLRSPSMVGKPVSPLASSSLGRQGSVRDSLLRQQSVRKLYDGVAGPPPSSPGAGDGVGAGAGGAGGTSPRPMLSERPSMRELALVRQGSLHQRPAAPASADGGAGSASNNDESGGGGRLVRSGSTRSVSRQDGVSGGGSDGSGGGGLVRQGSARGLTRGDSSAELTRSGSLRKARPTMMGDTHIKMSSHELSATTHIQHKEEKKKMEDTYSDKYLTVSVSRSGWLTKKGGGTNTFSRRNWKNRFFVLNARTLTYSKEPGSDALGTIDVKEIKALELIPATSGGDFCFTITTKERTYCCSTKTEEDREGWLMCLKKAREAFPKTIEEQSHDFMLY